MRLFRRIKNHDTRHHNSLQLHLNIILKVILIILVFLLILNKESFFQLFSGITAQIKNQSTILEQELKNSQRLEVTTVNEKGTFTSDSSVPVLGKIGSTRIHYIYTASIGIDLSEVIMTVDTDRIIFMIPEPEILNDGIEALEIKRNNFWSFTVDKSIESLLNEQRVNCREQYMKEKQHSDKIWEDTVKAFNETICKWLDPYGERQYDFEFVRQNDPAAEETGRFFNQAFPVRKKADWFCSP